MTRLFTFTVLCLFLCVNLADAKPQHALVLFGKPKYGPWFTHFDYTNPNAPKGGRIKLSYPASYDSLNPYILKGLPAPGLNLMFETLMVGSLDEPQTFYGLIARKVDLAEDRLSMTFYVDPRARWQDGTQITADDVVFSFETLKTKGDPFYKLQYATIQTVEKINKTTVRFLFSTADQRELPVIAAAMPVISKAYYSKNDFEKSSLKPPMASGPYKVKAMDAGRYIVYERDPKYWGANIPSRRGYFNFDRIRYDIYRDDTVALEALKSHEFDLYEEYIARNWATAYNISAVERGELIRYEGKHDIPRGMQAFLFNLRRPQFADPRVREAIDMTLDYEWMNRTIFFGAYKRNTSFFQSTPFAATGKPEGDELKLLDAYRDILPLETFGEVYRPPVTDGSGNIRPQLVKAQQLLNDAGWVIDDEGHRVNAKTGERLTVEFLIRQKTLERVISSMKRNLARLGIEARARFVDDAQYQKRIENKDFDVISIWYNLGLVYPGQEQMQFWDSSQADIPGSQNLAGLKNPAVDMLLQKVAHASTLEELTPAARALDRVLLWQRLIIPHWHISNFRVAYWDMFEMPKIRPTYGLGFETWWMKKEYR